MDKIMNQDIEQIEISLKDILEEIDSHLFRANWSKAKAQKYLIFQYHKNSRLKLTDDELLEFLAMVKSLPSKYPLAFRSLEFPSLPDPDRKQPSF